MIPVMLGLVTLYWIGVPMWILALWLIGFYQYLREERLMATPPRESEGSDEPPLRTPEIVPSTPSYPETEGLRCERCGRSFSTSWGS